MTTMPHIAEEWARRMGGQVVRISVPKSEVIKGLNVWQAEYLVPGGTRVLTFQAGSSLPLPSFGATARWAAETGAVGVGAVGAGTGLGYLGYKGYESLTPDHTDATTEPGK